MKACNDGLIERFCYRVPYPYHESDFVEFLAYNEHFWPSDLMANWTVVDVSSDELLAMISLDIIAVRQAGEIGYWCAPWARTHSACTSTPPWSWSLPEQPMCSTSRRRRAAARRRAGATAP